jgi:phosphoglycerate dehydrogenase-like enzyme
MAIGKVVVPTISQMMDKDTMAIFKSVVPSGWNPIYVDMATGEQKLIDELKDAEYLLAHGGSVSVKMIENAKKLKLIQSSGQDTGHLPGKWAFEHGIPIANAGGANAIAVSEFTLTLMLTCLKRFTQFNQNITAGKFRGEFLRKDSHELFGKTVGIVGFGNIGRRVAYLCHALGANIIYSERFFVPYALRADTGAKPVSLDELLAASDIVSVHVPSYTANRAMIGWDQLNKMKRTAVLVNTSRGANIDEKALARALNENKIAIAGIDVWDPEPPDPANPLLHMKNVIATPHVAGLSQENIVPGFETEWKNVVLVSEGKEPLSRVRDF